MTQPISAIFGTMFLKANHHQPPYNAMATDSTIPFVNDDAFIIVLFFASMFGLIASVLYTLYLSSSEETNKKMLTLSYLTKQLDGFTMMIISDPTNKERQRNNSNHVSKEIMNKISLPFPGVPSYNITKDKGESNTHLYYCRRVVHNHCVICLTSINHGNCATWSSNPDCPHVFHKHCILEWFCTSFMNQKESSSSSFSSSVNTTDSYYDTDGAAVMKQLASFPLSCPCCRQPFIAERSHHQQQQQQQQLYPKKSPKDGMEGQHDDDNNAV